MNNFRYFKNPDTARIAAMSEELLIGADILNGVYHALKAHAPELARKLEIIVLREQMTSGKSPKQGESVCAQYAFTMSLEDANAVLNALLKVEENRGSNATFNGRHINLLILFWRECIKSFESRPRKSPPAVDTG